MISKRTSRSYLTHAATAPAYWMIGVLWRVLATGVQSGNSMCLLDQICSQGSGPPRHVHPQDEGLYVISGAVTFNAGGVERVAGAGSLISVPRHTEHSFVVDEQATLINFYFPAGFELWLMGSAIPAQSGELPPKNTPMPPFQLTKKLSDDYGGLPLTRERATSPNPNTSIVPVVSSRRDADAIWFDRGCWTVLADAASTGGSYSVFEVEMTEGLNGQSHIHDEADEAIYLLEGALEVTVDDTVNDLVIGSFVFVPRGFVHTIRVVSETARCLIIHTAPGYERLVRVCGLAVSKAVLPAAEWHPPYIAPERLRNIHSDIGLRIVMLPGGLASRRNEG